jgi:hypothetical protein
LSQNISNPHCRIVRVEPVRKTIPADSETLLVKRKAIVKPYSMEKNLHAITFARSSTLAGFTPLRRPSQAGDE